MKVLVNWHSRKEPFRYPFQPVPRTAVLVGWFEERWNVGISGRRQIRVFRQGWCEEAARFAPEAIAATWTQLRELGTRQFPAASAASPTHAVIVLHREGEAPLTTQNRDWLWRRFGVPVFEQVIGVRGKVLAAECEAHEGMHVAEASVPGSPQPDRSPCPCGCKTPRIKAATQASEAAPVSTGKSGDDLRAVAAYAR